MQARDALAKARHAALLAGSAAIADDSGLCVDALGGAPGVLSARYAVHVGDEHVQAGTSERETRRATQDAANNRLLLERLHGVSERRARFVSVLVAVRGADDPEPLVALGRWHGEILCAPRGEGGFGYDPLMFIPLLDRTVAELSPLQKNEHSHRAIAARQMLVAMQEVWHRG